MDLRDFGQRCGLSVPRLSIGAMRFPRDVDAAVALVRDAIDRGLRYIDTSRGYGESEWILGLALKDGYREKVILSTKWSAWITKIAPDDDPSADRIRRRIEESMKRLGVEYLDFYQVWNIDSREHYDQAVRQGGVVEGIRKAKADGLVRHIGFTTHDTVENLLVYLDEADWCEILLTTYNLLNTTYAPVIEAAHARGIGNVIMNPVGGGKLAEASPILLRLAQEVGAVSVADMAVRYVASNPHVDTMLCGLSKKEDLDDSLASLDRGGFSAGQIARIDRFIAEIRGQAAAFCTNCKYCMPCPEGIDIPAILSCVQDARYWGWSGAARVRYGNLKGPKADACVACGKCEAVCTQHLNISREMAAAVALFDTKPSEDVR